METKMGRFAQSMGLEKQTLEGYDPDFLDAISMTRRRPLAKQAMTELDRYRQNMYNTGMEFSGAHSIEGPGQIKAKLAEGNFGVDTELFQMNEQKKNQALQSWLGVLAHEDTMAAEQRRMEMMEGDLLDQIGKFSALVGTFI